MAKYTYSVSLSNKDCIFDSSPDFDTAVEAVEWSLGRGGSYVAQIEIKKNGEYDFHVPISINKDDTYSHYDGWRWIDIPADKLAAFVDGEWRPAPPVRFDD